MNALAGALDRFARFPLIEGATPIQRLDRLERAAGLDGHGVRLFAKRDDLTGVGGGGNKLRKLEYLLGEALAQGCDTFVTTGGLQSNHARQSAAAAARAGLACELVLGQVVPRDDPDYQRNGNVLLDGLFGATIHIMPGDTDLLGFARVRGEALRREGRTPYVVGAGGSSPVGCLGYVRAAAEIRAQEDALGTRFGAIVMANGSAGTHAGLAAGMIAAGDDPARLLSYAVLAEEAQAQRDTRTLAGAALALLGLDADVPAAAIRIDGSQRGEGYGIPTAAMREAVRLLARSEGLLLDPVYSGKAFAGLLAMLRGGNCAAGDDILFLMTGGTPGLFAYRSAFETE